MGNRRLIVWRHRPGSCHRLLGIQEGARGRRNNTKTHWTPRDEGFCFGEFAPFDSSEDPAIETRGDCPFERAITGPEQAANGQRPNSGLGADPRDSLSGLPTAKARRTRRNFHKMDRKKSLSDLVLVRTDPWALASSGSACGLAATKDEPDARAQTRHWGSVRRGARVGRSVEGPGWVQPAVGGQGFPRGWWNSRRSSQVVHYLYKRDADIPLTKRSVSVQ